ncbi:MAG TPA: glycosyltransferase family 2 protein [Candidatus Limnocylindria bacterium]|nr:glycosyltransferase family 2 protein [Candidatus Limnocylindria bacterium]
MNSLKTCVVIPNWNGRAEIGACLDSLLKQSLNATIIVVENGSTDGSLEFIRQNYHQVDLVVNQKNLGFAGGVNSGIRRAKQLGADYVALLNNDALVHKDWLKHLATALYEDAELSAAASKLLSGDKKHIDSTGDFYTTWGLPFNRQRGEPASRAISHEGLVFGPCAGAALYRMAALDDVGLFDEDFFAYHEDADLHFRLQLAGWQTLYVPQAEAYHQTGTTSGKIKGFTTYQTFKNYPLLFWKNVPARLLPVMLPRFTLVYLFIYCNSLVSGRGWPATKGLLRMLTLLPKKLLERRHIQKSRKVSIDYINSVLVHDLPPNAARLRRFRALFTRSHR